MGFPMDETAMLGSLLIGGVDPTAGPSWWTLRHLPQMLPHARRVPLGFSEDRAAELVMFMLAE